MRRASLCLVCLVVIALCLHLTLPPLQPQLQLHHQLHQPHEEDTEAFDDIEMDMEEEEEGLIEWLEQAWLSEFSTTRTTTTLLPAFDNHFIEQCRASHQERQLKLQLQQQQQWPQSEIAESQFEVSLCFEGQKLFFFLFFLLFPLIFDFFSQSPPCAFGQRKMTPKKEVPQCLC